MDFLRLNQFAFMGIIGFLIFAYLVFPYILGQFKLEDEETKNVNKGRNVVVVLALLIFGWSIANNIAVNETPRSTIDRSIANERAEIAKEGPTDPAKANDQK
jgi:hypothetical protein